MGGSSAKPDDLKGNRPKSKEEIFEKKKGLVEKLKAYVSQIDINFTCTGKWYRENTLDLLALAGEKTEKLQEYAEGSFINLAAVIRHIETTEAEIKKRDFWHTPSEEILIPFKRLQFAVDWLEDNLDKI